jgi:hypothetical protein
MVPIGGQCVPLQISLGLGCEVFGVGVFWEKLKLWLSWEELGVSLSCRECCEQSGIWPTEDG